MLKLILAFSALLFGGLALYIDPKDSPWGRRLLLGVLLAIFIATALDDHHSAVNEGKHDGTIEQLNQGNEQLRNLIKSLQISQTQGFMGIMDQITKQGVPAAEVGNISVSDVQAIQQANSAYQQARASWVTAGEKPSSTQLMYFPRDVDPVVVTQALRDVGFNPEKGNTKIPTYPTNTLYVGLPVPLDEVKRVAFALMRAGVKLRQITHFSVHSKHPEHRAADLIQVGADAGVVNDPVYTVEMVQALQHVGEKLDEQGAND